MVLTRGAAAFAWGAMTVLSLWVFAAGVPYRYAELREEIPRAEKVVAGSPPGWARSVLEGWVLTDPYPLLALGLEAGLILVMTLTAAVIIRRRPADRMALFVSIVLPPYALFSLTTPDALVAARPAWEVPVGLLHVIALIFSITFLWIFPSGRFVPPWTRYLAAAWISWSVVGAFFPGAPFSLPNTRTHVVSDSTTALHWVALVAFFNLAGVAAQIYRYLRISDDEERRRTKWVVVCAFVAVSGFCNAILLRVSLPALNRPGPPNLLYEFVVVPAFQASLLLVPGLILFSVLRHRLFGIEVVVNRALVYAALTLCVVGIYVLVVGYLGNLFRVEDNLLVSLFATGIVAVIFAPLRDRLQRAANRLMYGERDEPYAVLSRLGQRLEGTLAPGAVLPAIVETVAGALKAPHAAISLKLEERFETAAEHGTPTGAPLVLPLVYNNETVGRLEVSPRAKGEPYAPADRRLLEDLARQAGVAAHAVRLTADLQRSRERLVAAREEERRRLRRDLHDGVGPRLAALTLKIETARNRLSHDPAADYLLSDLAGRAHEAVADVRRSVHALRPPVLDELGLIPALRETAAQYGADGLRVSVRAPETLPPLPAAVEVAAYRIAQEAMTNVVRHARARRCTVDLQLDGGSGVLRLEVEDDGRGLGERRGAGVGLHSMRERAEELGGTLVVEPAPAGGTVVRAELPWLSGRGT